MTADRVPALQAHDGRWHGPGPAMGTSACGALVEYRPIERWISADYTPADMDLCPKCFPRGAR